MNNSPHPPKLASQILKAFVPTEHRDVLLGDLHEEFLHKVQQQEKAVQAWYWRQVFNTSMHFANRYLASENSLRKITIILAFVMVPSLIIVIRWMSNVDQASDYVWSNILAGKVHMFLFTSEVWGGGLDGFINSSRGTGIEMYVHFPSIIWAVLVFCVLYIRNRIASFSAHQVAAWGAALAFSPYIFGLVYIEMVELHIKQIGPAIAFMVIPIVYITPPLTWFILRKTHIRQAM